MVTNQNSYSLWGWMSLYFGVTATPKKVCLVCSVCQEVIAETTDPAALEKYKFE